MRRWFFSLIALSCLGMLGGCQSCGNTCNSGTCGSGCNSSCGSGRGGGGCGGGGCGSGQFSSACWHGVCDCVMDDQCIARQPWLYGNVAPDAHNLVPAPAAGTTPAPAPPPARVPLNTRPMNLPKE